MSQTINMVDVQARQIGTNERSTEARLDPTTEDRFYRLYREYFQRAEDARVWNVWETIAWDAALPEPPATLTDAALKMYRDGLLLPDFTSRLLQTFRASRGRAWFVTHWSYEEIKAHLSVREWLLRAGVPDETLQTLSEEILTEYRWRPESDAPLAVMADALLWELQQIEETRTLRNAAESAGDAALVQAMTLVLADHEAQREFFRAALRIVAENYADDIRKTVEAAGDADAVRTLSALLNG